ncbi:hypothetical protein M409DRAFT_62154 [Zasmidium cellare ATCC 36951]|uniref:Enoyl reductase (ER) domain-containing protein n=1 Tax=Zasmidium cellare ATCC 36951 TaxID=1080233 RepID=A0A6A6D704_ZASCE|nr:uncharacterized protein M409DRAFT_62154 [Zasmidium cellare ATCC 36951]KAF2173949.1 hypothetical protein M409DRAFT_62154 [Zasmidium cellare ATCC 36951]
MPLLNLQDVPSTRLVAWLDTPGQGAKLMFRNVAIPAPISKGDVLVQLECTGVCHSDVHGIYGETPMTTHIPGHEGVGLIVKVGQDVPDRMLGSPVGMACPRQQNCGRDQEGTFSQFLVIPFESVFIIPEALSLEIAAPLLCAGITIFSAIRKTRLRAGNWLAIFGAGGGLGHIGLQIANAKGYRVIAIDVGISRRDACLTSGATEFFDAGGDVVDEIKRITGGYGTHGVIVAVGSQSAYSTGLQVVRNGGTVVCVGIPSKTYSLPVSPLSLIIKGITVIGTSVGTKTDMEELFGMAVAGTVRPVVEMFDFADVNVVLESLARHDIHGRAVLRLQ